MVLMGVCLALAAKAAAPAFVDARHFTLAWTHSIEKVRWEEDYAVAPGSEPGDAPVLKALQARVRGSAAGMEPPPDAVLKDGWFVYTPTIAQPARLNLTRSEFTADYQLCVRGECRAMSHWLPSDGGVTVLRACRPPGMLKP
ncbi:MAG: DUF1850 domain-containing protein [Hydrogenophaga sp.]|uniref:DUF1850 domain-containing protein n=1 Tax=Hydrogenophaga sp. TaxID=1904254 RepID=UPI003D1071CF